MIDKVVCITNNYCIICFTDREPFVVSTDNGTALDMTIYLITWVPETYSNYKVAS